jgi:flavin-binding protein dodecin
VLGSLTKDGKQSDGRNGEKPEKYEDLLDDGVEVSPVVKVIEVVATSVTRFEDAIARGVATAARSLRHIGGADVKHMTVAVRNGKISEYRVDLKIAFALDEDDEEGED